MPKIAIISDLHIGRVARSSELNPHLEPPLPPPDGFLDSFERLVQSRGLAADVLFVPGDISNEAHPVEYERATQVIQRVARSLGVADEAIFPVLGNHDLNWALIGAVQNAPEFGRELRFAPVLNSPWLRERLTSGAGQSQLEGPFLSFNETPHFYIIRYNSAESDLPNVKPHRGAVQQAHLDSLRDFLEGNPPPADKIRVFLTHHHPKIYSDPIPDLPDFSALVNAEALLDLLREHRFDLLVHGHKHSPKFSSSVEAGHGALSILCAGSFSRSIESAWVGRITNQFHIVDCIGRDPASRYLRGEVQSWAYQPRQWTPSNRDWSGIAHRIKFGAYPSEAELYAVLQPEIMARVGGRRMGWPDILDIEPKAEYADLRLVGRVLNRISGENGLILRFEEDRPEEMAMVQA